MNQIESNDLLDAEAITVLAHLPAKPALVVIGSTSYYHPESAATCSRVGELLATVPNLLIITVEYPVGVPVTRSNISPCRASDDVSLFNRCF